MFDHLTKDQTTVVLDREWLAALVAKRLPFAEFKAELEAKGSEVHTTYPKNYGQVRTDWSRAHCTLDDENRVKKVRFF